MTVLFMTWVITWVFFFALVAGSLFHIFIFYRSGIQIYISDVPFRDVGAVRVEEHSIARVLNCKLLFLLTS